MVCRKIILIPIALFIFAILACTAPAGSVTAPPLEITAEETSAPVVVPTPTVAAPPTETPPPGSFGPSGYPPDVDPLTGLTVADPSVLERRPLLVKVSNESPTVRPQSGLSFADHVWEYQMEGYALTRYTAVFLGQTPERAGSVRSARLIDIENLVDMYSGILVYSGGSSNRHAPGTPPRVNELMNAAPFVQRVITQDYLSGVGAAYNDPYFARLDFPSASIPDYHKLFTIPAEDWRLAAEKGFNGRQNLDGLVFGITPPAGGTATTSASIDYPGLGPRRIWTFDAGTNKWLSSIEDQQSHQDVTLETDMITGQQLAFDNVVIVHAFHWNSNFLEDEKANLFSVHINLFDGGDCVLLRDGQRYTCKWNRTNGGGMMQFFDASGAALAFKPGTTWFNVAAANIESAKPQVVFTP